MNKYLLLTAISMLFMGAAFSQQKVKDRTVEGNSLPNGNAILELESTNKGLLHTRVMLSSTTEAIPLSQHVAGMMVYNTATVNDVVPGIYYNDGTKWVLADGNQTLPGESIRPVNNSSKKMLFDTASVTNNSCFLLALTYTTNSNHVLCDSNPMFYHHD